MREEVIREEKRSGNKKRGIESPSHHITSHHITSVSNKLSVCISHHRKRLHLARSTTSNWKLLRLRRESQEDGKTFTVSQAICVVSIISSPTRWRVHVRTCEGVEVSDSGNYVSGMRNTRVVTIGKTEEEERKKTNWRRRKKEKTGIAQIGFM